MKKSNITPITGGGDAVAGAQSAGHTPWKGDLETEELKRPGGFLLAALVRCANERRQQLTDMARELNVTYGYINQLRNGLRDVKLISDDFTRSCAAYLNVPRMTVLILSGRVTASDFFQSDEQMSSELSRAMEFITEDPSWGPLITAELRQSSNESKYALVRLYEKANGKVLMSNCLDPQQLLVDMQSVPTGETATA